MTVSTPRTAPLFESIDSPQYIIALLDRLVTEAAILTIETLEGGDKVFISTLLGVDGAAQALLLDLPYSMSGYLSTDRDDLRVSVSADLAGALLRFTIPVGKLVLDALLPHYRAPFPVTIEYQQQRHAHRVSLSKLAVSVHIQTPKGQQLEARLLDLSVGGMRVRVDPKRAQWLQASRVVHVVIDTQPFSSEPITAVVSHTLDYENSQSGDLIIGFQFHTLNAKERAQLSHQVAGLERRLMRWIPETHS